MKSGTTGIILVTRLIFLVCSGDWCIGQSGNFADEVDDIHSNVTKSKIWTAFCNDTAYLKPSTPLSSQKRIIS